jgi:hypothetical protein
VFVALGIIFLAAVVRDSLKSEGKLTPARSAWLGITFIFAAVAIGLFLVQILVGFD